MKSFTFTLKTDCNACGAMLALNGPLRSITCEQCQTATKLTPAVWASQVCAAAEGMRILNNPYKCIDTESTDPKCAGCGQHFPIDPTMIGQDTQVACPHCGKNMVTYPAPDWLQSEIPGVVQVFGADRADGDPPAGASEVEVDQTAAAPVALSCPNCSAGLSVTVASPRLVACEHCGSDVFLPDALWRHLHPVKTVQAWTIAYEGAKLLTAADARGLAEQKREAQREREEQAAEEAERQPIEKEDDLAVEQKNRFLWMFIVVALVISSIVIALTAIFGD